MLCMFSLQGPVLVRFKFSMYTTDTKEDKTMTKQCGLTGFRQKLSISSHDSVTFYIVFNPFSNLESSYLIYRENCCGIQTNCCGILK